MKSENTKRPVVFSQVDVLDLDSGNKETKNLLVQDETLRVTNDQDWPEGSLVYDLKGHLAVPGLLDIHVHLREPGGEESETIATGTAAAARGGFTGVVSMANTDPVIDTPQDVRYVLERAKEAGKARVHPIAAVTMGLKGKQLTEMFDLADAGAVAFSDDGMTIMNAEVMRRALEYSSMLDKVIVTHAEDCHLKGQGVAHEGYMSTKLGLRPIPRAVEEVIVARDIRLVELTGGRVHVAHVSCASTVTMIREAQSRGLRVTGEVTPHHLVFTDQALATYDTNFKMAPPLREEEDRLALIQGLKDGVLQAVATDHAPHAELFKDTEFDAAPNGVVGCETAFAALYTALVEPGLLDLKTLVRRMSLDPAAVLGIDHPGLRDGAKANLTIIDLDGTWDVKAADFVGRSANSPWIGSTLRGLPRFTVEGGDVIFKDGHTSQAVEEALTS
ncbi:MAG: dihydroorotase [Candidatus Eisenbacteria bacterium]|uniref:Dihydroorotase n=1 Tax=Eiseniibacteriota bacterium TaxID=2212470 RepID=A0A7Y2E991_UNCEI|nr:dihydroorotase [Candidatus Eisenbacteria bacterium]